MDDALKDLVKGIADLSLLVSDVSEGFSLKEIQEVVAVSQDVQIILAEAGKMESQYLGLTDTARADVNANIAAVVKFPANADIQANVQKVLRCAVLASAIIQEWKL